MRYTYEGLPLGVQRFQPKRLDRLNRPRAGGCPSVASDERAGVPSVERAFVE